MATAASSARIAYPVFVVLLSSSVAYSMLGTGTASEEFIDECGDTLCVPKPEETAMQTSFNISIPIEDRHRCEDNNSKMRLCPMPAKDGSYVCIGAEKLCDQRQDCPGGEDENRSFCLYHKLHLLELSKLKEMIVRTTQLYEGNNRARRHRQHRVRHNLQVL